MIEASRVTTGTGAAVCALQMNIHDLLLPIHCIILIDCALYWDKKFTLDNACNVQVAKASNAVLEEEGEGNDTLRMQGGSVATDVDDFRRRPKKRGAPGAETVHTVEAARDCQLEFFKRMPPSICQNCGAHNPTVKK